MKKYSPDFDMKPGLFFFIFMNDTNLALLEKNRDILSTRDLATGTIATFTSYSSMR